MNNRRKRVKNNNDSGIRMSWNIRCMLCLLPSILGITLFYIIPYLRILYYSIINNQFQRKLVWFQNYIETFRNPYFILALKNSLLLIFLAVPLLIGIAVLLSILLNFTLNKIPLVRDGLIFPFFLPTAAIVLVWQQLFSWTETVTPIYLLFIWKNLGICLILLTAALTTISKSIYEAARVDGGKGLYLHLKITLPCITPAIFFTVLLSIVNSFKIFKESYLYYGNKYPPDHSYTLQFYMNNNFLKFDYQALATSSILTSILVLLIVAIGLLIQRRYQSY